MSASGSLRPRQERGLLDVRLYGILDGGEEAYRSSLAEYETAILSPELSALSSRAIKRPTRVGWTRLARRGKDFVVLLPSGTPERLAKKAVDAAAKVLEEAKK